MKLNAFQLNRRVLIVGGGNAGHVLVARCGSLGLSIDWLTTYTREAHALDTALKSHGGVMALDRAAGVTWHGCPERVSENPGDLVPSAEIILISLPAFAQEPVLKQIAPHVKAGTCIGVVPGSPSLDVVIRNAFKGLTSRPGIFFATRTLPWACRIQDYGQNVSIFGTKATDQIVVSDPADRIAIQLMQAIAGPGMLYQQVASFLFLAFTMPWHPCFYYGMFKDWDGITPYAKAPLFYSSITRSTADLITATSDEVLALKDRIVDLYPSIDLSSVGHVRDWFKQTYGRQIPNSDLNDLHAMITANPAYQNDLLFPMRMQQNGFVPDFHSRYLTEDVPFVLVVHLALAEMVGIKMPKLQHIVQWCQRVMGKEYLIDGAVRGRNVDETRAPQKYGYSDFSIFANDMGYL